MTQAARRIVVVSPTPALEAPGHAGGQLVSSIVMSYRSLGDHVALLAPSTAPTLVELERTKVICDTRLLGRPRDNRGLRQLLLTLVHRAMPPMLRWDPYLPWIPSVHDLLTDPSLRALLRGADVVDLQWEEYGRLAPLVKMLSPGSLITCMFHDVNDQRSTRRLHAADTTSIKKARRQLRQVQRAERRLTARLDAAFVLFEKDKKVLTSVAPGAPTRVVPPPLADSSIPMVDTEHREAAVGFVSALGRQENRDAAHRLVHSVWPLIHQALPDARLIPVGGGLDLSTEAEFLEVPGVEVTGFVDDLDAQYRRFSATLSPISTGAGVKFKILESIIRGLPTITGSSQMTV